MARGARLPSNASTTLSTLAIVVLLLAILGPLGSPPPASATTHGGMEVATGSEATVTILGHQFVPEVLVVTPGTTVTWVFPAEGQDPAALSAHTVTSGNPATGDASGALDSPYLKPGDTYSHTFTEEDTGSVVTYFCGPHRLMGMWGAVVVLPNDPAPGQGQDLVDQAQQALEDPQGEVAGDDGERDEDTSGDGTGGTEGDENTTSGDGGNSTGTHGDGNSTTNGDDGNTTASGGGGNTTTSDNDGNSTTSDGNGNVTTSGTEEEQPPPEGETYHVEVDEFSFDPRDLEVLTYDTVHWTNVGSQPHTVTSEDGSFDSGNLDPGDGFEHTFTEPGTYGYVCEYHQDLGQHGTVTVEARDDPGGSADATTTEDGGDGGVDDGADDGGDEGGGDEAGEQDSTSTSDDDPDHDHGTHDHGTADDENGTEEEQDDGRAGQGEDDGNATDAPAQPDGTVDLRVEVKEYTFTPEDAEVTVGDTVLWVNIGGVPHTVTSADGSFDSGHLGEGDEFQHTFREPGTYGYVCEYHRTLGQHGNLTVREEAADGPAEPENAPDDTDGAPDGGDAGNGAGGAADAGASGHPGDGNPSAGVVERQTPWPAPAVLLTVGVLVAAFTTRPRRRS